jgi:hypothetical protein
LHVLGQAELVIIDEAAAIPLPLVRQLIGPYLVFMASTINGYEGTGRSLSIKLIQQLRESTRASTSVAKPLEDTKTEGDLKKPEGNSKATVGRTLREIKLDEPIRYSTGDPVEKWLNTLLCLDASLVSRNISGCPHPSQCQLYHVSRDTLFSFHPASELFLQRMMALYVSSHYKNSPNDLQLMSDAPAHELFVLLPPIDADDNTLPEPLVVLQVAMEGRISKDVILESLARGERAGGDLIPWLMAQQVCPLFPTQVVSVGADCAFLCAFCSSKMTTLPCSVVLELSESQPTPTTPTYVRFSLLLRRCFTNHVLLPSFLRWDTVLEPSKSSTPSTAASCRTSTTCLSRTRTSRSPRSTCLPPRTLSTRNPSRFEHPQPCLLFSSDCPSDDLRCWTTLESRTVSRRSC